MRATLNRTFAATPVVTAASDGIKIASFWTSCGAIFSPYLVPFTAFSS